MRVWEAGGAEDVYFVQETLLMLLLLLLLLVWIFWVKYLGENLAFDIVFGTYASASTCIIVLSTV